MTRREMEDNMAQITIEQMKELLEPINNKLDKIINVIGIDITDNKPVQETLISKLESIDKKIENLISSFI